MTLTVTDLFCGAGGSSCGAEQVSGVRVRMAANHWSLAVATHNRNLPHVDHDTADISQVQPRRYPRTDILWASPECTNHSQAKGRRRSDAQPDLFGEVLPDEAAVRSRATMFDVLRFAEIHRYHGIVVENVVDVRDWVMWPAWLLGLTNLGYDHATVFLNSMFAQAAGAPAPQSRDRVYVVAWRRGNRRPDLRRWTSPTATCSSCGAVGPAGQAWKRPDRQHGRYRAQYVWQCGAPRCATEVFPGVLPAAVAIDWSLPGQQIGHMKIKTFRDKKTGIVTQGPLAPKTIARIQAGLRRHTRTAPLVPAGGTCNDAAATVPEPLRTRDTEALVVPVEGRDSIKARAAGEPLRTQTARLQDALVVPLRNNGVAPPAGGPAPVPAVAAAGNHHALVMRNMTARGDQGQMSAPTSEPIGSVLACSRHSLVRWDHLVVPYGRTGLVRGVAHPLPAQTTIQGDALIGPSVTVDDCTFRMLEPHEIQAAMAFTAAYVVLGNKRERVRQLGNAVTPPAARDLIAALVEALTAEAVA